MGNMVLRDVNYTMTDNEYQEAQGMARHASRFNQHLGTVMVQEWIKEKDIGDARINLHDLNNLPDIGLFDAVVQNYDRHGGNLKVRGLTGVLIDHNLTFGVTHGASDMLAGRNKSYIQAHGSSLSQRDVTGLARLTSNYDKVDTALRKLLKPAEVDSMWRRVGAMLETKTFPNGRTDDAAVTRAIKRTSEGKEFSAMVSGWRKTHAGNEFAGAGA